MKKSAATIRAEERNYFQSAEWFCTFPTHAIRGLEQEEGIHRRDPSSVILVGDTYYVYYTKSYGPHVGFGTGDLSAKVFPWDYSEIWVATSKDGWDWQEQNVALTRGEAGRFDDRSVFTPEILKYDGKYFLVYQTVQHPYLNRSFENIAIAVSDNPLGPFVGSSEPILTPSKDGQWDGDEDNRLNIISKGSFDSHKVHDPLLFHYNDKFYLYYKGKSMGEEIYMGGRDTMWGVAIADNIFGPYVKSEYNPVTNSGHETCLWQYDGGMAAFLSTDGVEKNTIQFAPDGINFDIKSVIPPNGPIAPGPFRPDEMSSYPLEGMKWGLSHKLNGWGHLVRFDLSTHQTDIYRNRTKFH